MIQSILLAVLFGLSSCEQMKMEESFFPGKNPGQATGCLNQSELVLANEALHARWRLQNNSIVPAEFTNKYDGAQVDLKDIVLFAIDCQGGRRLTHRDFHLVGKPVVNDLAVVDSLPTQALRFAGKEIAALLTDREGGLTVQWRAQLRNGANYLRQNIEIKAVSKAVQIRTVTFFDGSLQGASYAGLVLGSLIEYRNFFFGFEHPLAHSKALLSRQIGSLSQPEIDITEHVAAAGDYLITVTAGSGPIDYNLNSLTLLENDRAISHCKHPYNGENGSSQYLLQLPTYHPQARYRIVTEVENREKACGELALHMKTDHIINFFVNRVDTLTPGKIISEWSVMGVAPAGQKRRAFLYYLERERARPYHQFLHYNCWWDITDDGASSFTSEQLLERMHAWNEKFIKPYQVQLQSFVFDDGWDDLSHVWHFSPEKFPHGFAPQAELCRKMASGIGVWMSPFGGYLDNKRRRIASAQAEGSETNDKGLSLAGPKYYNRFLERALDMLDHYKVNYFKFDGFGGSEEKYLSDMEAGARLIRTLRRHSPDVYINITVGSWPSPFWLKYADCIWRGSGDLHMAGKGSTTQRFMTYRDGTVFNNLVRQAPYYPLNSIMTVGIAYANLGHPATCINDNIDDFKDMVWSFMGGGSSLQELYISHDRMKAEFWSILAEAAKWSKSNKEILKDTHWIGGSPINLQVYGFASWSPYKSIITLRNPDDKTVQFKFVLAEVLEMPVAYRGAYLVKNGGPADSDRLALETDSLQPVCITLAPFETRILEVFPN